VEQTETYVKSAIAFFGETSEEFRVRQNEIFLLGVNQVEKIELGKCALNFARAAFPSGSLPGRGLYTTNNRAVFRDGIEFVKFGFALHTLEPKKLGSERLAKSGF
jgi:hypothetical protein